MESLKVTSWNLEHADKLLDRLSDDDATRRRHAEARAEAVTEEIARLEADILLVSEGPRGEARATEFFARTAPGYRLITRGDDAAYGMKGGNSFTGRQWLWFLVRDESPITGQLLHLDRWQALTEAASGGAHRAGRWEISYPKWEDPGDSDARLEFSIPETHAHWRHPQVLQAEIGGSQNRVELANESLEARKSVLTISISDLEGVDQYEASTRVTGLETLLETSYALTVRISRLSLLNYL